MAIVKHRTRKLRRVSKKLPGGRIVVHYVKRKPQKARCSNCGDLLKGVPRERPYKMQTMQKSKKRPERPFGGVLCSKCMRRLMINRSRA